MTGQLTVYAIEGSDALKSAFKGSLRYADAPICQKTSGIFKTVLIDKRLEVDVHGLIENSGDVLVMIPQLLCGALDRNVLPEVLLDIIQNMDQQIGILVFGMKRHRAQEFRAYRV